MFFKNIRAYRINPSFIELHKHEKGDSIHQDFNNEMHNMCFYPCPSNVPSSCGWVEPLPEANSQEIHYAYHYNKCSIICMKVENKVLPAKAINEQVSNKVKAIKDKENRKVSRKEKMSIKDDVIADLMPKVPTISKLIYAYISWEKDLLIVNASSAKDAEMLINFMRETFKSFPVVPVSAGKGFSSIVNEWVVSGKVSDDNFSFRNGIELANTVEPSNKVKFINHDDSFQAVELIQGGFSAVKISLRYKEDMDFTVDSELSIKKISFSGVVQEILSDIEDSLALWLSEFIIQSSVFEDFISDIESIFSIDNALQ